MDEIMVNVRKVINLVNRVLLIAQTIVEKFDQARAAEIIGAIMDGFDKVGEIEL